MWIEFAGRVEFSDILLATDIRDIEIVWLDGAPFLYTTTGGYGGIVGFALEDAGGRAVQIGSAYYQTDHALTVTGHLVSLPGAGDTVRLGIGGATGAGQTGYALDHNGQMGALELISDPLDTSPIEQVVHVAGESGGFCYMVGGGQLTGLDLTQGRGVVRSGDNADFVVAPGAVLAGTETETARFVLVADTLRQGVAAFEMDTESGALSLTGEAGAEQGIGIADPSALATVSAFGQDYVLMGSAGSNSITVLTLDREGTLTPEDHVIDTRETRFGGVQSLATIEVAERIFVLAGGADDGISLFTLLPGGQLLHLQSLAHETGLGLDNVEVIKAAHIGDTIRIFVASGAVAGMTRFSVSLADLGSVHEGSAGDDLLQAVGADTLSGGAGDDILVAGRSGAARLIGGAGSDIFVLYPNEDRVCVQDFTVGEDRLELSNLPFLRNPAQLETSVHDNGILLSFGTTSIDVINSAGGPLSLEDLFGPVFLWPDRLLVLADPDAGGSLPDAPASIPGQQFWATAQGGFLAGTAGDDVFHGAEGRDNLWAQDGNDVLNGEEGADTLGGGNGNDSLSGGAGMDVLFGGADNDIQDGGSGDDKVWGGTGDDLLYGGVGDDSLGGSLDNDRIYGGEGEDLVFGDFGRDEIHGEGGADVLWAGPGDDLSYGNEGDDIMGGGTGRDTVYGGGSADFIFGGHGDDRLHGGWGYDTIYAGPGDDYLRGDSGVDVLSGGFGNDTLTGGKHSDRFGFGLSQGQDVITDFTPGEDQLDLYLGAMTFHDLDLRSNQAGDAVIYMGSGRITLEGVGVSALSADDFLFL